MHKIVLHHAVFIYSLNLFLKLGKTLLIAPADCQISSLMRLSIQKLDFASDETFKKASCIVYRSSDTVSPGDSNVES